MATSIPQSKLGYNEDLRMKQRKHTQSVMDNLRSNGSGKSVWVVIKFHSQLQGNIYRNPAVIQKPVNLNLFSAS